MGTIAKEFESYLKLFNQNDNLFKVIFSDSSGVEEDEINTPLDFNIGVVAGMLEWNRRLTLSLLNQLNFSESTGIFLKYFANDILAIFKYSGENDEDFKERITERIFGYKCSPASIIKAVEKYSSKTPEILEGEFESAFADVTFTDVYDTVICANPEPSPWSELWIFPAVAVGQDSAAFFFNLIMYDVADNNIDKVIDTVNNWKAAGVDYNIMIY